MRFPNSVRHVILTVEKPGRRFGGASFGVIRMWRMGEEEVGCPHSVRVALGGKCGKKMTS